MNQKVGLDRLLKLADHLETVPRNEFDMYIWKKTNCTAVACAFGHACTIPAFRRAGLHLKFDHAIARNVYGSPRRIYLEGNVPTEGVEAVYYTPHYKEYESFDAVKEFFGIGEAEAYHLFAADHYKSQNPTPKKVAERIRAFVRGKQKQPA